MSAEAAATAPQSAGVLRRLAAALYDGLLLAGVMIVITALLLGLTGGRAITPADFGAWAYAYRAVLVVLVIAFYGLFWTRRGQTLGMAAWRLRVQRQTGEPLTWSDTAKRLAAACISWLPLALGYFWLLIDRDRLAWHDRWTGTRVVVLPGRIES